MTTPQKIDVALGARSYPILIGDGVARNAAHWAEWAGTRKLAIVTNTVVAPLYADALEQTLGDRQVLRIVLPDGEVHKTLDGVARIIDALVANRFGRDDLLIALGGGVVGDMTGFAAACYQRGMDFIQVPTTLLAQVDSSVGGKTGVNHPGGKNLIGAFHQPRAVFADTALLRTLPPRELRAGLAEVIKYGLICDAEFFTWLEAHADELLALQPAALAHAIRRSCEIKAEIVARDEHERGDRALLNLGHTFGHAIETATGYASWLHGEAVGAGLAMAARMSMHAGWMAEADVTRIERLLHAVGLRASAAPEVDAAAARAAMNLDKKVQRGRLRFILMRGIGRAFVTADWPPEALERTLVAQFG